MEKRTERMYIRFSPGLKARVRQQARREGRSSLANMIEVLVVLGLHVREFNLEASLDVPLDDDK